MEHLVGRWRLPCDQTEQERFDIKGLTLTHPEKIISKSDFHLVKMCLEGDAVAWENLVRRYRRLIYHFPVKAGLPEELADDVFQDTCLALYQQLEHITRKDHLAAWIGQVAQRTTWKLIRSKRSQIEDPIDEIYQLESEDAIPDENLIEKVEQHQVRRAMMLLQEKCRKLLHTLFYAEEGDYQRVADELGIAIGSIGPTRRRCLGKLKKHLKTLGMDFSRISRIK